MSDTPVETAKSEYPLLSWKWQALRRHYASSQVLLAGMKQAIREAEENYEADLFLANLLELALFEESVTDAYSLAEYESMILKLTGELSIQQTSLDKIQRTLHTKRSKLREKLNRLTEEFSRRYSGEQASLTSVDSEKTILSLDLCRSTAAVKAIQLETTLQGVEDFKENFFQEIDQIINQSDMRIHSQLESKEGDGAKILFDTPYFMFQFVQRFLRKVQFRNDRCRESQKGYHSPHMRWYRFAAATAPVKYNKSGKPTSLAFTDVSRIETVSAPSVVLIDRRTFDVIQDQQLRTRFTPLTKEIPGKNPGEEPITGGYYCVLDSSAVEAKDAGRWDPTKTVVPLDAIGLPSDPTE